MSKFPTDSYIAPNVILGERVSLGHNVRIYGPAQIGDRTVIGDNVIIGHASSQELARFQEAYWSGQNVTPKDFVSGKTVVGANSIVLSGSVIYSGARIGDDFWCDHHTAVGSNTTIGKDAWLQYGARVYNDIVIGDNVMLAGFVANRCRIGNDVSMLGYLIHKFDRPERGLIEDSPIVMDRATIGMLALVIGRVTIGEGAYVGAGAVVTRDVAPYEKVVGVPARPIKLLQQLRKRSDKSEPGK